MESAHQLGRAPAQSHRLLYIYELTPNYWAYRRVPFILMVKGKCRIWCNTRSLPISGGRKVSGNFQLTFKVLFFLWRDNFNHEFLFSDHLISLEYTGVAEHTLVDIET